MLIRSRRGFLRDAIRSVTALGAAGALAKFGQMNAMAAGSSGYQALVCIFLSGGNDGHNTVIPIATAQQNFNVYQSARGAWDWRSPPCCRSTTAMTFTDCIHNCPRSRASIMPARQRCWPTSACS